MPGSYTIHVSNHSEDVIDCYLTCVSGIDTWDCDSWSRNAISTICDIDLSTTNVELSTAEVVSIMQSNVLSPN